MSSTTSGGKGSEAGKPSGEFSPRAVQVLNLACREARRRQHRFVGTEHLLLGMFRLGQATAIQAMLRLGVKLDEVMRKIEENIPPGSNAGPKAPESLSYTPQLQKVLAQAARQSRQLRHARVGTEHFLLGLLADSDNVAARILADFNLSLDSVRGEILKVLGEHDKRPKDSLMKLGIINSTFQQAGVDTAAGLKHIARIGFDTVDIFTEAIGMSKKEISLVANTTAKLGLPIASLPVVAFGLVDFNESVREFHVERCKKYIDLAKVWGASNILLVLGEYVWQREVITPEKQWHWAVETCRRLGDYAGKKKIDIALELEPFRLSLISNVGDMVRFLDDCDHPRVRANIDVSHLVLSDTSPPDLKPLQGRAIHVHLSDCDGKVHGDLPPGRGVVKFAPYLQAIKELEIDGVVSIELEYAPDPSKIVEWVEEAYRETAKLMALTGLRG